MITNNVSDCHYFSMSGTVWHRSSELKKRWFSLSWVHGLWITGTDMLESVFPFLRPAKVTKWPSMRVSPCTHWAWWPTALQVFWQSWRMLMVPHFWGHSHTLHPPGHPPPRNGLVSPESSTPYPRGIWRAGHGGSVLAIGCRAWIMLSLGAAGYVVEGSEKIVHNLWSMWIIFLWHLKNSWQREKCWVKGNNPLLPSPLFDCCNSCWKGLWEICWMRLVIVLPIR